MTYTIRDFLEIRMAAVSNFSPDGSKLVVASNLPGMMQVYRVARAGGPLTQLTDLPEPVSGSYMPASDQILMHKDSGGNERTQIYLLDDDGSNMTALTDDPEHIYRAGGVTRDGKTLFYSTNRRNGTDFDVFARELSTGDERCIYSDGGMAFAAGVSPDGRYAAFGRLTERPGDSQMFITDLVDDETFEIAPHDDEAEIGGPSWMPDSETFFFSMNHDREFSHLCRFDLRTREWERVVERDHDVDGGVDWTGTKLLLSTNEDGFRRIEILDPRTLEVRRELPVPRRGIPAASVSKDGRFIAYTFHSPVDPGDVWLYDTETEQTSRLTTSPNPIPEDVFVEPTVERFRSFDGEEISALVFRPRKPVRTPCPVVVSIHGGPESQYMPIFSSVTQYFLYRGYAVVAPNVRGSTGYGKRFEHLDDVRKRLDSVRDLEALHAWLRAQPDLDHTRAALSGGSYGGYMVLAGLAFQPELWAAGIDIVGISSLVTFLENTSSYRRKVREREYGWLDRDRDFLVEASPITHVDRMRAPLFIIHGSNDPRVPLGEAEQIHRVLKEKGVPTELLVYEDEGHGLGKLKNRLDAYPKAVDFLDRVLLG